MSGQDPMADIQDLMGYQGGQGPGVMGGLVGQNPYLTYQGQIPMAGFYTGTGGNLPPTDANGNPIQSFVNYNNNAQAQYQQALAAFNAQQQAAGGGTPGTTLNTPMSMQQANALGAPGLGLSSAMGAPGVTSQTPYGQPGTNPYATAYGAGATPQQMGGILSQMSPTIPGTGGNMSDAFGRGGYQPPQENPNYSMRMGQLMAGAAQGGGGAAQQGTPPTAPNLRQAYLTALAEPGPVPTYGAGPPQAGQVRTGSAQQPSVLQAFMAQHPGGGTTGAGGYSNQPFFATLNKLQGGNVG